MENKKEGEGDEAPRECPDCVRACADAEPGPGTFKAMFCARGHSIMVPQPVRRNVEGRAETAERRGVG